MSVDLQSVQPSLIPTDRSADKRLNPNAEYDVRKFALSHTEASSASAPTVQNKQWFTTLTNDDHVLYISCMSETIVKF